MSDEQNHDGSEPVNLSEVDLRDYSYATVIFSNGESVGQCSTADLSPRGIEMAMSLAARAALREGDNKRF